jgi:DNA adenine methylase
VSVEDTQEIRKTLGRAFKLKSDDSNLFVSNVELVSNELVEWVHESRSEELVKYAFTKSQGIRIFKADKNEEERITFGVVLEPEEIDAQKDTVSIEEIEQAAYRFMEDFGNLGLQHSEIINGRTVLLESYIAPVDFEVGTEKVKAGSWLMKLRIVDEDLWEEIKSGAITGYSIGGSAIRKPV